MRSALPLVTLAAFTTLAGCPGPEAPAATPSASSTAAALTSSSAPTPSGSSAAAPSQSHEPGKPYTCGELSCRDFDSAAAAVGAILEESKPALVAFGESHALKGAEVPSTATRFSNELLPVFKDKASALVLELWAPDPKCGKEKIKEVEKKQKVVTDQQAPTNKNEFVVLGEKSREVGIVPFLLKPTCDDFDKVQKAGNDPVAATLASIDVITRNMKEKATTLFDETTKKAPGKMVLTYGGALHNDLFPKKDRESWSYAADLDKLAPGKYVELDLVVPEYIKDTDAWKSFAWYPAYDKQKMSGRVVVINVAPRSYTLVFAATKQ
ncbi:MAG: hypothetical protein HOV80_14920 [Polyangiaceae bacterium]|nr:hypothetical protein [Polyangiaceae bacterium]